MIKSNYHVYTYERNGFINRLLKKTDKSTKNAVLIHGLSSGSRTWDEAVIYLLDLGYNVMTLDLSGHGDSGRVEQYSFNLWVNNVLDSMKQYGIERIDLLMGHSLGGLISLGVSNAVEVEKIVLIDPLVAQPSRITAEVIKRGLLNKYRKTLKDKLEERSDRNPHMLINDIYHIERWDSNTLNGFSKEEGLEILSIFEAKNTKPATLLLKPIKSMLLSAKDLKRFQLWGVKIIELENVGHGLHLDNFLEFKNKVTGFINS
jgi:pimeloyl-ACP methyl ester carboxylesterase